VGRSLVPGAGTGNDGVRIPRPAYGKLGSAGDGEKGDRGMSILAWIIVGIISGWLARMVIPCEGPAGLLGDLVFGVVGALVGGWIFNSFGHPGVTGVNIGSIVVAFIGAVGVLWLMRLFTGTRQSRLAWFR
jgi:uncharacterized membrane protein YeaQ/YmgE (transglycosylase-associated protein family)